MSTLSYLLRENHKFMRNPLYAKQRSQTKEQQLPIATVLTCSDSRLSPELIFSQGIGSLFVIRNAGNVCNTDAIASAEYAYSVLNSKVLIVMGHESCGAVEAALGGGKHTPAIDNLIYQIRTNIEKGQRAAPHEEAPIVLNAIGTKQTIFNRSSMLRNATDLEVYCAYYQLDGEVFIYDA